MARGLASLDARARPASAQLGGRLNRAWRAAHACPHSYTPSCAHALRNLTLPQPVPLATGKTIKGQPSAKVCGSAVGTRPVPPADTYARMCPLCDVTLSQPAPLVSGKSMEVKASAEVGHLQAVGTVPPPHSQEDGPPPRVRQTRHTSSESSLHASPAASHVRSPTSLRRRLVVCHEVASAKRLR